MNLIVRPQMLQANLWLALFYVGNADRLLQFIESLVSRMYSYVVVYNTTQEIYLQMTVKNKYIVIFKYTIFKYSSGIIALHYYMNLYTVKLKKNIFFKSCQDISNCSGMNRKLIIIF